MGGGDKAGHGDEVRGLIRVVGSKHGGGGRAQPRSSVLDLNTI